MTAIVLKLRQRVERQAPPALPACFRYAVALNIAATTPRLDWLLAEERTPPGAMSRLILCASLVLNFVLLVR